ncbi:MAG: Ig-like domain-containing protein, partial [Nitrososphaera sp.]|nr:Ig-like domain-containing protein [Nitrososphaera sp.]
TTLTASGTASDTGSGLDEVEVLVDNVPFGVIGRSSWSSELDLLSEGEHTITVRATDNAGNTDSASIVVTILGTPSNIHPVADAGYDLRVLEGSQVTLDGSGSRDNDGAIALFSWSQTSGFPVDLDNSQDIRPAFNAPAAIVTTALLEFELQVTDNDGLTNSDTIRITVVPASDDPRPFSLSTTLDGTAYTVVGEDEGAILISLIVEPDESAVRLDVFTEEETNQIEVTFPESMISGIHTIMTDDGEIVEFQTSTDDTTSTVRFSVPPDTSFVEVIGTRVVPEFPFSALTLLAGLSVGLVLLRIKQSQNSDRRN